MDILIEKLEGVAGNALHRTTIAGVVRLSGQGSPGAIGSFEELKTRVCSALATELPFAVIWLSDSDEDIAQQVLEECASAKEGVASGWIQLASVDLVQTLPLLYRGAWAAFLGKVPSFGARPDYIEFEPECALSLVLRVRADAAVFAWHDDVEWMIVCRVQA